MPSSQNPSTRDELIEIVARDPQSAGGDRVWASDFVDSYSADLLRAVAARLDETNPDRSADFSEGVDWVLSEIRRIADEGGAR